MQTITVDQDTYKTILSWQGSAFEYRVHNFYKPFLIMLEQAQRPKPDFTVENEGTIYLLRPHTPAARKWIVENLGQSGAQFWGEAVVIEHRFICDIVDGIKADDLEVR